jgi:D-sedoheptulose 7-phosphate isomerase
MTLALPGLDGDYAVAAHTPHPLIHQETTQMLCHMLWETVDVFFERHDSGMDTGDSGFLFPFLEQQQQATDDVVAGVAASIRLKVQDAAILRAQVAADQAEAIGATVQAMWQGVRSGGKLILFGNGGSASGANDWTLDCVCPPEGYRPIPAVSLALEPANITAAADDGGADLIFQRQLIAQAHPGDMAVAISTNGGSRNIIMALEEARKRKLTTVALLGCDGGEVLRRGLADFPIVVGSDYIPRIQEVQTSVYHVVREALEAVAGE